MQKRSKTIPATSQGAWSGSRTFQRCVDDPLLDLGLLHQVDGACGQEDLPRPGLEALPVVLNHWHAVLKREHSRLSPPAVCHQTQAASH